eukprot:Gb_11891 [translate_table: standard]
MLGKVSLTLGMLYNIIPLFVAVHYRAWTESTMHKFEDTWQEQQPLELVLGKVRHTESPMINFHDIPIRLIPFLSLRVLWGDSWTSSNALAICKESCVIVVGGNDVTEVATKYVAATNDTATDKTLIGIIDVEARIIVGGTEAVESAAEMATAGTGVTAAEYVAVVLYALHALVGASPVRPCPGQPPARHSLAHALSPIASLSQPNVYVPCCETALLEPSVVAGRGISYVKVIVHILGLEYNHPLHDFPSHSLQSPDVPFMGSVPLWLIRWEKKVLSGLAIGVASMKAGERALFHVGWQLGYGEEGNFSFPNVPPMADLIYEVELIGFEEAKEGKARSDMTVEERIEAADRRRQEGNEFFKEDKLAEAMQQYEMALAYMGDDFMFQLFGKYKDMANAVKNPCHLNMAACLLKLNRYEEVIGQCSMVLVEDENNIKALFRRGKARAALGQTDDAREDFQKVKKFAPEDKAVIRELRLLAEHDRQVYQKQRELYKGLFGPKPKEKAPRLHWLYLIWQWLLSIIRTIFRLRQSKDD